MGRDQRKRATQAKAKIRRQIGRYVKALNPDCVSPASLDSKGTP